MLRIAINFLTIERLSINATTRRVGKYFEITFPTLANRPEIEKSSKRCSGITGPERERVLNYEHQTYQCNMYLQGYNTIHVNSKQYNLLFTCAYPFGKYLRVFWKKRLERLEKIKLGDERENFIGSFVSLFRNHQTIFFFTFR